MFRENRVVNNKKKILIHYFFSENTNLFTTFKQIIRIVHKNNAHLIHNNIEL